ncbi:MAG: hypothetical protein IJ789_07170 [Bacteroidales bacterium]|nr:hypothetical protein [Bacteroidales bacterium]
MKKISLLLSIIVLFTFQACKVDFSPNAEWKEIPIVFCVLDQDEDTIWARVQRCYLPNGDIQEPAMISDSINFPQGYITVDMLAMNGNSVVDSFHFDYTTKTIDTGSFARENQPMYYYVPSRKLDSAVTYRLIVRHTAGRDIIAEATTNLISNENSELLYVNHGRPLFSFQSSQSRNQYNIQWNGLTNARRYEPVIRFYYSENSGQDTLYADIPCGSVLHNGSSYVQMLYYGQHLFLADLKEALKDDPAPKNYLKTVDVFITACNEDLNAYINSSSIGGVDQFHRTYSNINNGKGIGIFAARRTHLHQTIDADPSNGPRSLYQELLKLGLNFQ